MCYRRDFLPKSTARSSGNGNVPQHRWPRGLCKFTSVFSLAGKVKMSKPCWPRTGAAGERFWLKLVALLKDWICSVIFVGNLFGKAVAMKPGFSKCYNLKSPTFVRLPLESARCRIFASCADVGTSCRCLVLRGVLHFGPIWARTHGVGSILKSVEGSKPCWGWEELPDFCLLTQRASKGCAAENI